MRAFQIYTRSAYDVFVERGLALQDHARGAKADARETTALTPFKHSKAKGQRAAEIVRAAGLVTYRLRQRQVARRTRVHWAA